VGRLNITISVLVSGQNKRVFVVDYEEGSFVSDLKNFKRFALRAFPVYGREVD